MGWVLRTLAVVVGVLLCQQCAAVVAVADEPAAALKKVPDKLVVLTFDDASASHFTVVRPLLLQYGFSATFFVTEGWDFATNKDDYMSWEQIKQLHTDGFEVGNHTRDHLAVTAENVAALDEQLQGIEQRCAEHGIPKPTSFAWPGNSITVEAFETLRRHGIVWARRGGAPEYPYDRGRGFAFEAGKDHPLLLPSAGDARPDWELDDLIRAVSQAKEGRIAILQFHGVPDTAHDWVSSDRDRFIGYLKYLQTNDYQVIALRDLSRFVDAKASPQQPLEIMRVRREALGVE